MNSFYWKPALLTIFLFSINYYQLQANTEKNRYTFSLLTYDVGSDLYAIFGHSAIRKVDHDLATDYIYNYGTFNFDAPNFYLSFLKGKLPYRLSKLPTDYVIAQNKKETRRIIENEFILTEEQSNNLAILLETNYLPENREYLYDFLYDNCATRIIDLLDNISENTVSKKYSTYSKLSFRKHIGNYLIEKPWTRLGINILMGLPADKPASPGQTAFLPDLLLEIFKENPAILSQYENTLVAVNNYPKQKKKGVGLLVFPFSILIISISIFGYLTQRRFRFIDHILIWPSVLMAILLIALWVYSDLEIYTYNMNLFWANPLMMLILIHKKSFHVISTIILISLLIGVIYTIWFTKEYAIVWYSVATAIRLLLLKIEGAEKLIPNVV